MEISLIDVIEEEDKDCRSDELCIFTTPLEGLSDEDPVFNYAAATVETACLDRRNQGVTWNVLVDYSLLDDAIDDDNSVISRPVLETPDNCWHGHGNGYYDSAAIYQEQEPYAWGITVDVRDAFGEKHIFYVVPRE